MKKFFIFVFIFITLLSIKSQDVLYDTLNQNIVGWLKISNNHTLFNTFYEREGILFQSKVLLAAGIIGNAKYKTYSFKTDTILYEFKSNSPLNFILFKFFPNDTDTYYYNMIALRKSELNEPGINGKHLYVFAYPTNNHINIYNGTGENKSLVLSIPQDTEYKDIELSNEVTIEYFDSPPAPAGFTRYLNVSHGLFNTPTPIDENSNENVQIYPNPVSNFLNIIIPNEKKYSVKILTTNSSLIYQGFVVSNSRIDVSSFQPGEYILLIIDENGKPFINAKIIKN